jgi:hypothetical protein
MPPQIPVGPWIDSLQDETPSAENQTGEVKRRIPIDVNLDPTDAPAVTEPWVVMRITREVIEIDVFSVSMPTEHPPARYSRTSNRLPRRLLIPF